ncbi:MAG: hypothetical protein K1X89_14485 [Myxococcaceae bacterium]|nr:hypothetical protein [Myxococcaceae bacterium]
MSLKPLSPNVGTHSAFRLVETRKDQAALQEAGALVETVGRSLRADSAFDLNQAGKTLDRAQALLTGVHQGGVTVKQRPLYEETVTGLQETASQVDLLAAERSAQLQTRLDGVQAKEPELFEALRSNGLVMPDAQRPGRFVPAPSLAALAHGPSSVGFRTEVSQVRGWPPRGTYLNVDVLLHEVTTFVVQPRELARATQALEASNAAAMKAQGHSPVAVRAALDNLKSNGWRPVDGDPLGWPKVIGGLLERREVVLEQATRFVGIKPVEYGNQQVLRSVPDLLDFVRERSLGVRGADASAT